jgi:hypothetical protein
MNIESLPFKGSPNQVIKSLEQLVLETINQDNVIEFYLGRTNNLPATQLRHGCNSIHELYETESLSRILEVEDFLIKTFKNHPKCSNKNAHSGGNISPDYFQYFYIALWE